MRKSLLAAALVAPLAMLCSPQSTSTADAFVVAPFPFFFPISDCGTVGLVDSFLDGPEDDSGEGGCLAWFPDSGGGAYLVDGLDAFEVGDRVFVDGLICDTCLTTCAAGAILESTISECQGGGGQGLK